MTYFVPLGQLSITELVMMAIGAGAVCQEGDLTDEELAEIGHDVVEEITSRFSPPRSSPDA